MSRQSAIASGRRAAERGMTDECRIGVPVDRSAFGGDQLDEETLRYPEDLGLGSGPVTDTVYQGPCQIIAPTAANTTEAANGEAVLETQDAILKLPMSTSGDVTPGCVVFYGVGGQGSGWWDATAVYEIVSISPATHATARRCRIRSAANMRGNHRDKWTGPSDLVGWRV